MTIRLLLLSLLLLPAPLLADYRLDVWDKLDREYPIATRRFISFYDCRSTRLWLLSLADRLEGKEVYITCYNTDLDDDLQ